MAKPAAPALRVRKWTAGEWTDSPDAVVTEEPLQLMLHGQPLSVVMRTPGQDIELSLGLMFSEGIVRGMDELRLIRISAEAGETEKGIRVEADLVESNQIDVHPSVLPGLVEVLRAGQGVFERTGGLHAAGLFSADGKLQHLREDIGRHNAVDKVVGRALLDRALPAAESILVVSGRAGYEIVQKSISAGIPVLAAVGAPSSLAVSLAREFNQTLVGFLRGERFNVYAGPERLTQ